MKPSNIIKTLSVAALSLAFAAPLAVGAKSASTKKENKETVASDKDKKENTDSIDFKKSIADAKHYPGMIDAYLKKDGKLILCIPDSVYDHDYMMVSRVNGISQTTDIVAGEMNVTPFVIRFSKDPYNVYLHLVQYAAEIDKDDPIYSSYQRNFVDPIAKAFKIELAEGDKSYIDATGFFVGDNKLITPIKESDPIVTLLTGKTGINGTFYEDGSAITEVKSFPENLMVKSRLAYTTENVQKPYTVAVSRSIVRLPDEPMRPRLQDNRVGYFYDVKNHYSSNLDRIENYQIINRFRVEPKDEDLEAYFAGELVEPKEKIIFYVDSAFPKKWSPAIKEGIEYWNTAFEAAGFKNVIEARDYPEDDPDFDVDDIRKNCVRYSVTPTANAMGPSYVDPRTGEVLGADVLWYHNVLSLLHDWRFVQTGAVDERVRKKVFDDDVMYESLTYVVAHEIGHCLGLMHNMGASYAFTVDNLRDPEFTGKYGTTPSIMDYARNNFVAQPGDFERGVKLVPPPVGVYDIHAINWGYRLIPGVESFLDEKPILDSWIREHDGDPMYEFGAQQVLGLMDFTDQTEDLGNDHVAAGDLAISNLKLIIDNFEDWVGEPGEDYVEFYNKYVSVANQYLRHLSHVVPYIGGVRFKEVRQGHEDGASRNYLSKTEQKRAMNWLVDQIRHADWLEPARLMVKFEEPKNWRPKIERSVVACFTSPAVMGRIKKGYEADPDNGYLLEDFLDDSIETLFTASYNNEPLTSTDINMQSTYIATVAKASGLETLTGVSAGSKGIDALQDFEDFMALTSAPAIACSGDHTHNVADGSRSFFRLAIEDNPLPEHEMKPLMARQLRNIRALYAKSLKKTSDARSKDFYRYQLQVLDKLLQ